MVEQIAAIAAAATKIQALARGNRDRKKVEANLMEMIEMMMAASEKNKTGTVPVKATPATPPVQPTEPPPLLKEEPQSSHDSDDADESVIEEEIIVLIDGDTEDEDGKEETVVEIVTYEEDSPQPPPSPPRLPPSPPPSPPRPKAKSAFERYNEQLKKPLKYVAPQRSIPFAPPKKFGRPKDPFSAARETESVPKKETINTPGKLKLPSKTPKRSNISLRGLKSNPSKQDLDDISNHLSKISTDSSDLDEFEENEEDSSHGSTNNRIGIPWLRPGSNEPSSREPSPPPLPRPVTKNPLVNRYLNAAVKRDASEYHEKIAQIEADRSRGRWNGAGPDPRRNNGDTSKSPNSQAKKWKWKQAKPPRPPAKNFDKGAAIKLQAQVRGVLARRRVAKMVDDLIEEMMRKMNKEEEEERLRKEEEERLRKKKEDEEERKKREEEERRKFAEEEANRDKTENYFSALRKKQVAEAQRMKEEKEALRRQEEASQKKAEEEERRRQEEEEARRKEKEEEDRRQKEEEDLIRREWEAYHNRKGLPLWWMERVPHNTLSQKQYELKMKKDKVPTIIEYKPPIGWEKRVSKPLRAVAEEIDENENDANLDKILPDFPDAALVATKGAMKAPEAAHQENAVPKQTKAKQRGSLFSCMCMDAIEEVEAYAANNYDTIMDPNTVPNTYEANDDNAGANGNKDSSLLVVDRLPDEEQAPSSPSVTKIVVEHDVTENVKIVVEQ